MARVSYIPLHSIVTLFLYSKLDYKAVLTVFSRSLCLEYLPTLQTPNTPDLSDSFGTTLVVH